MNNETREIRALIGKLNKYTKAYDEGHPLISDKEYDDLYFELVKLEKETGIIFPDSPTQSIPFDVVNSLSKVKHVYRPMLSLDKTKNPKEVQDFVSGHEWCGMFKLDGLSVRLTYINGVLTLAETRGNGEEGEDITHNILHVPSVPRFIPTKDIGYHNYEINSEVIIDGEIICTYSDFEEFSKDYENPRNFAAGSIRLLNSEEAASRKLTFIAWDLVKGIDEDFFFWRLEKLDDWGFFTVPRVGDAETIEDAISILDSMKEDEYYSDVPIDGYVFKFESVEYGNSLGRTAHHWRNAIAYKFYDEEYETELTDIEWSMGRTGVLTPVAIFKPVTFDGSTIERASLHNLSVLRETLGLYPEQKQIIWIAKMNQIIPQITRAEKNNVLHDHILDNGICNICPICGKPTSVVKSDSGVLNVVCKNPECSGQLINKVDHFCGKKGLDIKGISKATIEKLIDWGWLNNIKDIFKLKEHRTEWISKAGFGKASVDKILTAIDNASSKVELKNFIAAIGIPLVGGTVAKDIGFIYSTWNDFRDAVGGDWTEFEGFGPEINRAINNFDYTEADEIANNYLTFVTLEDVIENIPSSANIKDKIFVVTGKLQNYTRDSIKAEIESFGGKVTGSVSSKTDYLICNDKNSTTGKSADAKKLGIPIITEEEYLKMKS